MSLLSARRLRRTMTEAEKLLWSRLRDRRLGGLKFRRQVPLGVYVLDFFCEESRLIVEVDGGQHAERAAKDDERTAWLKTRGCRVIRFWNIDVMRDLPSVLDAIHQAASGAPHPTASPPPSPPGRGKSFLGEHP